MWNDDIYVTFYKPTKFGLPQENRENAAELDRRIQVYNTVSMEWRVLNVTFNTPALLPMTSIIP